MELAIGDRVAWMAIVNPRAGALLRSGSDSALLRDLERAVAGTAYTTKPGDAERLASQAGAYDGLVAVGGDGTVREVLAGMDRRRQCLAIVPAGRGNSLARHLGLHSIAAGIAALGLGRAEPMDLMQVETAFAGGSVRAEIAASTVASGYVAAVVRRAMAFRRFGRWAYLLAALVTQPKSSELDVAEGARSPCMVRTTGLVLNKTRYLANWPAFPDASLVDGRMRMIFLDAGWMRQTIENIGLLSGHFRYAAGRIVPLDSVRVRLRRPSVLLLDGDLVEEVLSFNVVCLPRAVDVWRPGNAPCAA